MTGLICRLTIRTCAGPRCPYFGTYGGEKSGKELPLPMAAHGIFLGPPSLRATIGASVQSLTYHGTLVDRLNATLLPTSRRITRRLPVQWLSVARPLRKEFHWSTPKQVNGQCTIGSFSTSLVRILLGICDITRRLPSVTPGLLILVQAPPEFHCSNRPWCGFASVRSKLHS